MFNIPVNLKIVTTNVYLLSCVFEQLLSFTDRRRIVYIYFKTKLILTIANKLCLNPGFHM